MNSYIREILRWWELKMRLRKCKDAKERSAVRRSVGAKYAKRKPTRSKRDKAIEAQQSELRG